MTINIPEQWPPEVTELYEPVRELGKGGFASVLLAKRRQKNSPDDDDDDLVAIKVAGSKHVTNQEVGYAHREIEILQELTHPNIMRLIQYWEPSPSAHLCAAVMILNYARGPTLYYLLKSGGALHLTFCRVVAAQLVDAVAYCHSRAVMHRDIKPDNVVVTGAATLASSRDEQDQIWDHHGYKHYQLPQNNQDDTSIDWEALVNKWHVTLVDFGFARALTPNDMDKKFSSTQKMMSSNSAPSSAHGQGSVAFDSSSAAGSSIRSGGSRRRSSISKSISHRLVRKLSAVGNRHYAAPEIMNCVELYDGSSGTNNYSSRHSGVNVTRTLSDHVAYYGIMADAYSVGNTIRYMISGVPPNMDIQEAIANQNHPIVKFGRYLSKKLAKKAAAGDDLQPPKRRVKYRSISGIPPEVVRLIKGLTHYNPQTRTSVRTARLYPWIDDVLVHQEDENTAHDSHKIHYLSIALRDRRDDENDQRVDETATTMKTMTTMATATEEAADMEETTTTAMEEAAGMEETINV